MLPALPDMHTTAARTRTTKRKLYVLPCGLGTDSWRYATGARCASRPVDGETGWPTASPGTGWSGGSEELARDLKAELDLSAQCGPPDRIHDRRRVKQLRGEFRSLWAFRACARSGGGRPGGDCSVLSPICVEADAGRWNNMPIGPGPECEAELPSSSRASASSEPERPPERWPRRRRVTGNYFGPDPQTLRVRDQVRSPLRISDGAGSPGWINGVSWTIRHSIPDDGSGRFKGRTNRHRIHRTRARRERKVDFCVGGVPISPLLSNLYMRRFILGWKGLGYARRFKAEIVNYADDARRPGPNSGRDHADGGRGTDEASEADAERGEDPRGAGAGGTVGVPRLPDRTQLPSGYGASLCRDAPQSGERSEPLP